MWLSVSTWSIKAMFCLDIIIHSHELLQSVFGESDHRCGSHLELWEFWLSCDLESCWVVGG